MQHRGVFLAIAAVTVVALCGVFLTQTLSAKPQERSSKHVAPQALVTEKSATSGPYGTCFDQCAKKALTGGKTYGPGYIVGTGPACQGDCTRDCYGRRCVAADATASGAALRAARAPRPA